MDGLVIFSKVSVKYYPIKCYDQMILENLWQARGCSTPFLQNYQLYEMFISSVYGFLKALAKAL